MPMIKKCILLCLIFTLSLSFGVSAGTECKYGAYTYIIESGKVIITGCDISLNGEVSLPSALGGYDVYKIDGYAFEYSDKITGISVPDSVKMISQNAFYGCTSLKNIIIGNGIEIIPDWAFYGCTSLESITIGSNVSDISSTAFEGLSSLKQINVSSGNKNYYSENGVLFSKDKELICYPQGKTDISYRVGGNAETITDGAFAGAKFSVIMIPASVNKIEDGAFSLCENLSSFTVDDNSLYFSSLDGVLFNKNKTVLIAYPENKASSSYELPSMVKNISSFAFKNVEELTDVKLPAGLELISSYAFYGCENLKNINLPDSVVEIGESAFTLCRSLEKLILPEMVSKLNNYVFVACEKLSEITLFDSLSQIGNYSFGYCENLWEVDYTGDEEGWNSVEIKKGNECFSVAQINFNKFIYIDMIVSEIDSENVRITAKMKNPPKDGYICVATYENGGMSEIKMLDKETLSATVKKKNADSIKLFVWSSNLSPLK